MLFLMRIIIIVVDNHSHFQYKGTISNGDGRLCIYVFVTP